MWRGGFRVSGFHEPTPLSCCRYEPIVRPCGADRTFGALRKEMNRPSGGDVGGLSFPWLRRRAAARRPRSSSGGGEVRWVKVQALGQFVRAMVGELDRAPSGRSYQPSGV
jgi:hypothetical protein